MLDFFATDTVIEDPALDKRIGGIEIEDTSDLERLKIINSNGFNKLSYFDDQYLDSKNVKDRLELAINIYTKAKLQPGYKSHPAEKLINLLQIAVDRNLGIQTICD